jgi:nifR3 family TIM-barrel protein
MASTAPLRLGRLTVDPPVVLAPMAGVTNMPFRALCRRHGGGLFVSEMVGARALVEADERTLLRAAFADGETPRSIQLYAVDPAELADAVGWLVDGRRVDHVDLNVGCPAPKVTRHGGGAALPWKLGRFAALVSAAVEAARGAVPVTVKMRLGIDAAHLTYLDAGRAARDAGAAAVALHARTAEQAYAGSADHDAIARLVEALDGLPVLGNGDIWQARDALAMMTRTGCAGVVVGRGCLGRPWLFRDLDAALAGRPVPAPPRLGEVAAILAEHGRLLADHLGEELGTRELRKHTAWYLQGFDVGRPTRLALRQVGSLDELAHLLGRLDGGQELPATFLRAPRGHTHGPKRVRLPHGWLDDRDLPAPLPREAALAVSGG